MFYFKNFVLIFSVIFSNVMRVFNSQSIDFNYNNTYGVDYGTKWIYFPDGNGTPHYVNLTIPDDDDIPAIRGLLNNDIEYRLYTKNRTDIKVRLDEFANPIGHVIDLKTILCCKPLKVITHGWLSTAESSSVVHIKNAYLEVQDVNVITVDWSGTAGSLWYHRVARETLTIGLRIASFLDRIHDKYKVLGEQVHLIGHSLGAHVVGIAASSIHFRVGRVTGLDPASPLFERPFDISKSAKLDPYDAEFVDIIHTCGGILGYVAPIGTVDFYPNDGIAPQPGCGSFQMIFEACSHGRAFQYFAESIRNPTAFPSAQCQSWKDFLKNTCDHYGYMGDSVTKNVSGKFYLKTNAFWPFGRRNLLLK